MLYPHARTADSPLISLRDIVEAVGISSLTGWRWTKHPDWPQPTYRDPASRRLLWVRDGVIAWLVRRRKITSAQIADLISRSTD